MRRRPVLVLAAVAAAGLAVAAAGALAQQGRYAPGPENISLPADWQQRFIRYTTVDKPDRKIIRSIYINPEACAALRPGQPMPHGTLVIMADQRARPGPDGAPLLDANGRFIPEPGWIAIAAQQKEPGWGEGYGPEKRNDEWEYARFQGDGARNNASVEACFTCHLQARAPQDVTFTTWDYAQTRGR